MIIWLSLLIAYAIGVEAIVHTKFTKEENWHLQRTCGYHRYVDQKLAVRGRGGYNITYNVRMGEYPSSVAVLVGKTYCSGTLISPRHVLTSANCILYDANNDCNNVKITHHRPISMKTGICRPDNWKCAKEVDEKATHIKLYYYWPSGAYVPLKCNTNVTLLADMVVITLQSDIPSSFASPACLPPWNMPLEKSLTFVGFGETADGVAAERSHWTNRLSVIESPTPTCPHAKMYDVFCTQSDVSVATGKGDSGGGFYQTDKHGRQFVVGVNSMPLPKQRNNPYTNVAVDMRKLGAAICDFYGICP